MIYNKSVVLVNNQISYDFRLPTFWKPKPPKRRILTISDQTGTIEMWGPNINKLTSTGEDVSIICLNVDVYMGRVSLHLNISMYKVKKWEKFKFDRNISPSSLFYLHTFSHHSIRK